MQKLTQIARTCSKFQDNCLQQIKDEDIKKPTFTITYNPIGSDNSGKLTKKASPQVEQLILNRLKWNTTKEKLKMK
jgi:hypothetical protein